METEAESLRLGGGGRSIRLPGGSDIFSKSVKLIRFSIRDQDEGRRRSPELKKCDKT